MISFRFHVVSLTAVFLALAIGIAVGATVVDRATVDALETQLDRVAARVDATDAANETLRRDLGRWTRFAEQARDEAVAGRLEGVPVLLVGVQGLDRGPVDALAQLLAAAGARIEGTVMFTSRLRLDKPEDALLLAGLVRSGARGAEAVRRAAIARVAEEMAAPAPSGLLPALRDAAFVDFQPPAGTPVDLATLPVPGSMVVVVSDDGAEVPNGQLAGPLAVALGRAAGRRVLAAEPGRERRGSAAGARARFVGPLRADDQVAPLLSTVDNLEDFRGRFAVVYALRDLAAGKVGHFGVAPSASRLVPESAA